MRANSPSYWTLIRLTPEELRANVAASPADAARWVEAAAHNGSIAAILNWGQMLLDGHGVARDPQAALRWFKIAADTGDADGINMVGRCHENGWGVPVDKLEAARCFNLAAQLRHVFARFNLGMLLLAGDGERLPRDIAAALSLFVGAARQGNAKAMNMLGRFREEGWQVRAKPAAAMRWYARAASRGCFRGQFHLARFLAARGDVAEAAGWLRHSLAAAPADFCREVATMIASHPAPEIAELASLARAAGADQADAARGRERLGARRRKSRVADAAAGAKTAVAAAIARARRHARALAAGLSRRLG